MRFWMLVGIVVAGMALVGCGSAEVTSDEVKEYQNAGRDPNDPPIDPNTGQPVENN